MDTPKTEVQASLQEYVRSRDAWIAKYGSDRLKLAKKLDLLKESDNVYREERRNHEKPGWRLQNEMPAGFRALPIHNPSLAAMQLLEQTLEEDPDVRLVRIEWSEELSVPMDWKGRTRTIKRGLEALASSFIGLPVYRYVGTETPTLLGKRD